MRAYLGKILLVACMVPGLLAAYTLADFNTEVARFADLNNRMVKACLPSYLSERSSRPILAPADVPIISFDLSPGLAVVPSYMFSNEAEGFPLFWQVRDGSPFSLTSLNFEVAIALPQSLMFALNLGGMAGLGGPGSSESHMKAGVTALYRLMFERFYGIGLLAGFGYHFTAGDKKETLKASTDSFQIDGRSESRWETHAMKFELFIHKVFFLVNFYTRLNLYYLDGTTSTTVSGTATGGSTVSYTGTDTEPGFGVETAAGFEIILGRLKASAEAGREWLNGSLYGTAGVSYEW